MGISVVLPTPVISRDGVYQLVEVPQWFDATGNFYIQGKANQYKDKKVPDIWKLYQAKITVCTSAVVANRQFCLDHQTRVTYGGGGVVEGVTLGSGNIAASATYVIVLHQILQANSTMDLINCDEWVCLGDEGLKFWNPHEFRLRLYNNQAGDVMKGYFMLEYMNPKLGLPYQE